MDNYKVPRYENFRDMLNDSVSKHARLTAFQVRQHTGYRQISYQEVLDRYYRLCSTFIHMGYQGKPIAVIGKNSYEWVMSYLAAATVGIAVPLDKELKSGDIVDFLNAAGCVAICYADAMNIEAPQGVKAIPFSRIEWLSGSEQEMDKEAVDAIELPRDKTQILIFTSGTTGNSKGVCLSQFNILSDIYSTLLAVKVTPKDRTLSILPLHHTYECTLNSTLMLSVGATICYSDSIPKVAKNMTEYSPTILVVVPALLKVLSKKIKRAVMTKVPQKYQPYFEELTFAEAMAKLPFALRQIVILTVKKSLGGKLRLFIVGAAELDPQLVVDFNALGIRTLQGYGLTECSPLLAGNTDFWMNMQSTGRAMPGVELKIDNPNSEGEGEILAKGDNIMLHYYNDEEATNAVFRDGWFCTGDLGYMDEEGYLYIRGRIKNVIVTENGKNIYPEELESRLEQFEEISEVLVVPDVQRGITTVKARILPNVDVIRAKMGRLPSEEEVRAQLQNVIAEVNQRIPTYKHIKKVEVLDTALEKTTTQKIKRFGANLKKTVEVGREAAEAALEAAEAVIAAEKAKAAEEAAAAEAAAEEAVKEPAAVGASSEDAE